MDTLSAVTLAGETACALFDMLVDYIDDVDFLLSGFFHAFKERSCYVHRVTFFTLGTAVKNKYFHSVFSPSASQFYADIFIINPCESHVNPRSAEWIISMIFSLFRFWRMVAVTRISSTLFIRFLYYNVQSLLGVIFDLVGIIFFLTDCSNFLLLFTQGMGKFPSASIVYCLYSSCVHNTPSLLGVNLNLDFCFLLDCLARSFFLFDVRGPRGGNLLQAMYRSIQI